jgi:hypothetical protein
MPAYDFTFKPLNLLVDEISPDGVRATVSYPGSIVSNMLAFIKHGLVPAPMGDSTINGIFIMPAGKYVGIIVKASQTNRMADGMVFLDLTDRQEVIDEIAQKFGNAELEKKFLQTVDYIFANPDTHSRFRLFVSKGGPFGFAAMWSTTT